MPPDATRPRHLGPRLAPSSVVARVCGVLQCGEGPTLHGTAHPHCTRDAAHRRTGLGLRPGPRQSPRRGAPGGPFGASGNRPLKQRLLVGAEAYYVCVPSYAPRAQAERRARHGTAQPTGRWTGRAGPCVELPPAEDRADRAGPRLSIGPGHPGRRGVYGEPSREPRRRV